MPLGGSPSLVACCSLGNNLGCRGASPSLGSYYSVFLHPSRSHPKLENFNHTKLNKTFMRSFSITKQITTISTVANPFIFCFCIISTVFQLCYSLYPPIQTIDSPKEVHNAKKTESVKNRTVCSNLICSNTSGTPKFLKKKLGQPV